MALLIVQDSAVAFERAKEGAEESCSLSIYIQIHVTRPKYPSSLHASAPAPYSSQSLPFCLSLACPALYLLASLPHSPLIPPPPLPRWRVPPPLPPPLPPQSPRPQLTHRPERQAPTPPASRGCAAVAGIVGLPRADSSLAGSTPALLRVPCGAIAWSVSVWRVS